MSVALFDLDNTLLEGDSDYQWGQFLVERKVVDATVYERENRRFFAQYEAGTLDIYEFARFAYRPLAEHALEHLFALRANYIEERIIPLIRPKARDLLAQHRDRGNILVIITSTNRFITEPIAKQLGVDDLIATDPEFKDGRYTGELAGIPCFQEGKVKRLQQWLKQTENTLHDSWFYTDSHNDLPLLQHVSHPVVVDADGILTEIARKKGWPSISLSEGATQPYPNNSPTDSRPRDIHTSDSNP